MESSDRLNSLEISHKKVNLTNADVFELCPAAPESVVRDESPE